VRTSVKVSVALACFVGVWLAVMVVETGHGSALRRLLEQEGTDRYATYFDRIAAAESARWIVAPVGALAGGLLADALGGELVLLVAGVLASVALAMSARAPESLWLMRAGAILDAAAITAIFPVLAGASRRRLGLLAAVAFGAWIGAQHLFIQLFWASFERDDSKTPTLWLAAGLPIAVALAVVGLWLTRARAAGGTDVERAPYRAAPPPTPERPVRVREEWLAALRDRRTWLLVVAAVALGGFARWVPDWCSMKLPYPDQLSDFERTQVLVRVFAGVLIVITLPISDFFASRRAWVLAAAIGACAGLDAWLVDGGAPLSVVMRRALAGASVSVLVPLVQVVAASLREKAVGLRCGLVACAVTAGSWATKALFFERKTLFELSASAGTWVYVLAAVAMVALIIAARSTPHGGARTIAR
jgi:hypothetical protein